MDKASINLSIVLPSYNEEKRIEDSLLKIKKYFESEGYGYEVIVSDDGSKDNTLTIVEKLSEEWRNLRVIKNPHRGKAPALISGMKNAKNEIVIFSDVDLSVSIEETPKFVYWINEQNYDIAIATREGVGAKRVNEPFTRHVMGRIFNMIVQLFALPGIKDTQCGFKAFKKEILNSIFIRTRLYTEGDPIIKGGRLGAYDVELLFIGNKLGYKIKEVPITWIYGDKSKVHKFKDSYNNTMDVVKVRLNDLKGLYN